MMIEIVDLPSYKMVIFHSFLYVYSWVIGSFYIFWPIPMSCGSATGTWFGNVNEVRNPTVVVKNFLACSGHRLLADDSVHMLWYQLISTRLFLCIFKVQQFRPWQMFVELIYIYIYHHHNHHNHPLWKFSSTPSNRTWLLPWALGLEAMWC